MSVHVLHVTTVPQSLMFLRGLAARLREVGGRMSVVSSPGPGLVEFGEQEGVAVHAVEMPRRISPLADLRALGELTAVIARAKPDIVHAHTPKGGLLGVLGGRAARAPRVLYHMRGLPLLTQTGLRRVLLTATEWISTHAADRTFCVSHSLRDAAIEHHIGGPSRFDVLGAGSGQGVDVSRFDPKLESRAERRAALGLAPDAVVFTFVGRLAHDKGLCELEEAWRRVARDVPGAVLLIVGAQDARDPADAGLISRLEERPSVSLLGRRSDTPHVYAASDVVVLPSYREGFPNVPLEAAAMALPVVTTDAVGCRDAVEDGVTGVCVPVADADALAAAMVTYGLDTERRQRDGAAGRGRVERHFTRARVFTALLEAYGVRQASAQTQPSDP